MGRVSANSLIRESCQYASFFYKAKHGGGVLVTIKDCHMGMCTHCCLMEKNDLDMTQVISVFSIAMAIPNTRHTPLLRNSCPEGVVSRGVYHR